MANVRIVEKNAEIDGKPIKWSVLSVQGYMNGEIHTLELKVNKTEAMLANMLLKSEETAGEVRTKSGGEVEVKKQSTSWLD